LKSITEPRMALLKQWSSEGLLSPAAFENLTRFVDLLAEWNQRINLTGLGSREEMESLLIGESILAARAFPMSGKRVLDFGSGAGIPGLVWAIYDPSIELTSVEIREKKVAFQKEVIRTIGLDAEVMKGIFPQVVKGRQFDVIATRAIRFSSKLWAQAVPLVALGGSFIHFANSNSVIEGWRTIPISDRSALLLQTH
jgi:16S rRNA (guanine527-N7)-methyltransferase